MSMTSTTVSVYDLLPANDAPETTIPLAHGATLVIDSDRSSLEISDASGQGWVSLVVTAGAVTVLAARSSLRIAGAESLDLEASTIRVRADELDIRARTATQHIEGDRTTTVGGVDRLEASSLESQASHGPLILKAEGAIRLDGARVGLNDDPCPMPFAWSERARELAREIFLPGFDEETP
ncbi:MAG: hypothetical protein U0271_05785 [Polyangiaceae bacterium]